MHNKICSKHKCECSGLHAGFLHDLMHAPDVSYRSMLQSQIFVKAAMHYPVIIYIIKSMQLIKVYSLDRYVRKNSQYLCTQRYSLFIKLLSLGCCRKS
jgi:hypothetical protein